MTRRTVRSLVTLSAAILVLMLVGCDPEPEDDTSPSPTSSYPPPVPPSTTPEPPPTEPSVSYPLNQQQAYRLAEAGISVAGRLPSGLEVMVIQSSETTYEEQPVEKEVCGYEYDYYEERNVRKCRYETVYEERPVEKTIYVLTGAAIERVKFANVAGAFSQATALGAERWREF